MQAVCSFLPHRCPGCSDFLAGSRGQGRPSRFLGSVEGGVSLGRSRSQRPLRHASNKQHMLKGLVFSPRRGRQGTLFTARLGLGAWGLTVIARDRPGAAGAVARAQGSAPSTACARPGPLYVWAPPAVGECNLPAGRAVGTAGGSAVSAKVQSPCRCGHLQEEAWVQSPLGSRDSGPFSGRCWTS